MLHAGITVSNLDRSLAFYSDTLGLEVAYRRLYREPHMRRIVGVPDGAELEVAMLKVPGAEFRLELLEYRGCERHPASARPCDFGAGHVCLRVSDIGSLWERLQEHGVAGRSSEPVLATAGPNEGSYTIYVVDPDGYHVELHQPAGDVRMDCASGAGTVGSD